MPLRFDPDNFSRNFRQKENYESIRLGMRHSFVPCSDIIATFIYQDTEENIYEFLPVQMISFDSLVEVEHYMVEMQHLFRSERLNVTSGAGHFSSDRKMTFKTSASTHRAEKDSPRHTNSYVYSQINFPKNMTWTVGGSADFFEGGIVDRDQFNPKLGLTWSPLAAIRLRAAVIRTSHRTLISSQTLEPTQVAGFNQFFDDQEGTESWRYGAAIDQRFSPNLYGGIEFSERDMEIPFRMVKTSEVERVDWEKRMGRAYLYWPPYKWLGTSAEYEYERLERDLEFVGVEEIQVLETRKLPIGINFYHPSGFATRLKATYIDQEAVFGDPRFGTTLKDSDQFWVVDASISYHLPKRRGVVTIEARNLLNEEFKFQDSDLARPVIYPENLIFAKVTLAL